MAFVPVAKAVSGRPASSAENNKLIDNVNDLHARMGDAFTAENNVSTTMQATINRIADVEGRLGEGVGTTNDPVTGTATAQLGALRNRVAAVEGATGAAYSTHAFRQTDGQTIPPNDWYRVNFDTMVYSTPAADVTPATVAGGTEFTVHRSGLWRVAFTGSLAGINATARILLCVSANPVAAGPARAIYSEKKHIGTSTTYDRYSDSIGGTLGLPAGGKFGCWVWHTLAGGWNTFTENGRMVVTFEWVAPLPA
jgi:hypothetical protein